MPSILDGTHEITGHDDAWEYAVFTVKASDGRPIRPGADISPARPPGEGWVPNTGTGQPPDARGWVDRADGTARTFYWKRPLAYSILNREAAVVAAADPTTAQLAARNNRIAELEKIAAWRLADIEAMNRAATMQHEKLEDERKRCRKALDQVGDLTRQLLGAQREISTWRDAHLTLELTVNAENAKVRKYETALVEIRRGHYSTKSTLAPVDRDRFDRIYCMIDESIAWQTADVRTRIDARFQVLDRGPTPDSGTAPPNEKAPTGGEGRVFEILPPDRAAASTAPIPMFLTCPMCNTRHLDVGEFATKPHHTHACQDCGLTWRPAIGPTVGVRYLPGFKNAGSGAEIIAAFEKVE